MPDRSSNPDQVRSRIQDALYRSLIDKIRNDTYPSTTMMDAVEAGMSDRHLAEYAEALLEKIENDQYPSIDLMRRLAALGR
jgi:hypothetical protein